MLKRLVYTLLAAVCLLWPAHLSAAAIQSDPTRESITSFKSKITVGKDAVATVTEEIVYDMDGVAHHGLERLIPVSSSLSSGKYINYNFDLLGVTEDGRPNAKHSQAQENSWYRIRIGDPDKTITGVHTYTISYTYGPVVTQTSQGDVFDYNVFGTHWVLPAKAVEAEVNFPEATTINDTMCYSGFAGSRSNDCTASVNGSTVNVAANRSLNPNEGLNLQVLMPSNSFTAYTTESNSPTTPPLTVEDWLGIGIFLTVFTGTIAFYLSLLVRSIKERLAKKRQTIVPQYESPNGLSPAEVGLLIDKNFGAPEIVATLVDLAIRGYIKIRETRPKSWFRKAEYELDLIKHPTGLKLYEHTVLGLVFDNLDSKKLPVTEKLTKKSSSESFTALKSMTKDVEKSMKHKGFFKSKGEFKIKGLVTKLIFVVFFTGVVVLITVLVFDFFNPTLAIVVAVILTISLATKPNKYTQLGYEQWAKVKGFEWFLTVTEKDRMKFENAPAKTPALFNKLLPYAIALGVEKKWAKQFDDLDLSKATDWYSGSATGYYSAVALTSSLNSSFSSVVSSNVTPSSSGGSFGGGFSGGGW